MLLAGHPVVGRRAVPVRAASAAATCVAPYPRCRCHDHLDRVRAVTAAAAARHKLYACRERLRVRGSGRGGRVGGQSARGKRRERRPRGRAGTIWLAARACSQCGGHSRPVCGGGIVGRRGQAPSMLGARVRAFFSPVVVDRVDATPHVRAPCSLSLSLSSRGEGATARAHVCACGRVQGLQRALESERGSAPTRESNGRGSLAGRRACALSHRAAVPLYSARRRRRRRCGQLPPPSHPHTHTHPAASMAADCCGKPLTQTRGEHRRY